MLILLGWDLLYKIYSIIEKNKYESQKNQGYKKLV